MPSEQVLGVVLAGGASRRMGFDKRVIEIEGRSLVERAADALRGACSEVVVSLQPGATWEDRSIRALPDLRVHSGPLAGLEAGLVEGADSGRSVFVLACDLPHVTSSVIQHILAASEGGETFEAAVPSLAGQIQPLCGLYKGTVLRAVREHLDTGRRAMHDLLDALVVEEVTIGANLSFYRVDLFSNLNEPRDLQAVPRTRSR